PSGGKVRYRRLILIFTPLGPSMTLAPSGGDELDGDRRDRGCLEDREEDQAPVPHLAAGRGGDLRALHGASWVRVVDRRRAMVSTPPMAMAPSLRYRSA